MSEFKKYHLWHRSLVYEDCNVWEQCADKDAAGNVKPCVVQVSIDGGCVTFSSEAKLMLHDEIEFQLRPAP